MKQCKECGGSTKNLTQNRCKNCYSRYRYSDDFVKAMQPTPTELSPFQLEVLDGLLLGDGCLFVRKRNGKNNPCLKVGRQFKDRKYLMWAFNVFKNFCSSKPKSYMYFNTRTNKQYKKIEFSTRLSHTFMYQYNRWYPNGVKIVPKDIKLTPLIVAIWLADDGTVYPASKRAKHRINLKLYTNGFTKLENEFLISLLYNRYNETFSILKRNTENKTYYYIFGNNNASRKLLNDIDAVFPISMKRKTYWRTPEARFYENIPAERENLKNIVEIRLRKISLLLMEVSAGTAPELAEKLGWYHSSKGQKKPSRTDALRYLKRLVAAGLAKRNDKRTNKGFVYYWIGNKE